MANGFSLNIANIAVGMLRGCGGEMVWGQPNYNFSMNFFISASCSRALRKRCHWLRARVRLCSG